MELGGDDQWSNMLAGTELIRRKLGKNAYAMTQKLLLNSEGVKMGKTVGGAIWLDAAKTSPYDFYQYWRNVEDVDVIRFMKMLTFIPIEELEELEKTVSGAELNAQKARLAYELTKMVHGEEEADKAQNAAQSVFGGSGSSDDMPTTALENGVGILDALVGTGLAPSKAEARRLIQGGGISADGEKVTDPNLKLSLDNPVIIKKGKKVYHKITKI
jgi:tyrosyl-tRNA synthetase